METTRTNKLAMICRKTDLAIVSPALPHVSSFGGSQVGEESSSYDVRMDKEGRISGGIESVSESECVSESVCGGVVGEDGWQLVACKHRAASPKPPARGGSRSEATAVARATAGATRKQQQCSTRVEDACTSVQLAGESGAGQGNVTRDATKGPVPAKRTGLVAAGRGAGSMQMAGRAVAAAVMEADKPGPSGARAVGRAVTAEVPKVVGVAGRGGGAAAVAVNAEGRAKDGAALAAVEAGAGMALTSGGASEGVLTAATILAVRRRAGDAVGQSTAAGTAAAAAMSTQVELGQQQQVYDKELTVVLELQGTAPVSAMEIMRAVRALCGGLVACRATGQRSFEVTLTHVKGKERLLDGFKVGETVVHAKGLCNDELVVSFLNLPAYITDEEILTKLDSWGVGAASPIRRRMWPGTRVADGTRFLKVKFNDRVQSLPYSARFETALGPEYFRVIHDRQVRVCRMCLQPGHILRDCPSFFCNKCGVQGHYARECGSMGHDAGAKCRVCNQNKSQCACGISAEEEIASSAGLLSLNNSSSDDDDNDEEEMEQGGPLKKAGVAVMADPARAGPPEQVSGQQEPSRRAGVAVRADLAWAGPPVPKVQPDGPLWVGPMVSSLDDLVLASTGAGAEGGSNPGEEKELPSTQAATHEGGSASGAPLPEGRPGQAPVIPQTPREASSDTDPDLETIKLLKGGRKQKRRKTTR